MASPLANVLVVGCGGVGTLMAYALEKGGKASVTAVLRSNFAVVTEKGFIIDSVNHGQIEGWRPQNGMAISLLSSLCQPHHHCSLRAARRGRGGRVLADHSSRFLQFGILYPT